MSLPFPEEMRLTCEAGYKGGLLYNFYLLFLSTLLLIKPYLNSFGYSKDEFYLVH